MSGAFTFTVEPTPQTVAWVLIQHADIIAALAFLGGLLTPPQEAGETMIKKLLAHMRRRRTAPPQPHAEPPTPVSTPEESDPLRDVNSADLLRMFLDDRLDGPTYFAELQRRTREGR